MSILHIMALLGIHFLTRIEYSGPLFGTVPQCVGNACGADHTHRNSCSMEDAPHQDVKNFTYTLQRLPVTSSKQQQTEPPYTNLLNMQMYSYNKGYPKETQATSWLLSVTRHQCNNSKRRRQSSKSSAAVPCINYEP